MKAIILVKARRTWVCCAFGNILTVPSYFQYQNEKKRELIVLKNSARSKLHALNRVNQENQVDQVNQVNQVNRVNQEKQVNQLNQANLLI